MLLKKLLILTLSFFALTLAWAEDAPNAPSVTDTKSVSANPKKANDVSTPTDQSKPIIIKSISPVFNINLPGNITTGYQWYLVDYNPRFVRLLGQKYTAASTKLMGAPGLSVWQFQLQQISFTAPQVTRIIFEYRRPWEPKAVKKASFTVLSQ